MSRPDPNGGAFNNNEKEEKFSVIGEDWETVIKPPDLADALVRVSDLLWADALIAAGKRKGIICRNLKKEKAEELVNRLKALGVNTFMVSESQLIKIPQAVKITKLSCLSDTLLVSLEPGSNIYSAKWEDIVTISCGYVRQTIKDNTHSSGEMFGGILGAHIPYLPIAGSFGAGLAFSMAAKGWTAENTPEEKVKYLFLADIITKNPILRFRIESTHFAYTELGSNMKPDTFNNFKELVKQITSHASQACLGKGVETVSGKREELQKMTFWSIEEFDRYDAWLIQKAVYQPK